MAVSPRLVQPAEVGLREVDHGILVVQPERPAILCEFARIDGTDKKFRTHSISRVFLHPGGVAEGLHQPGIRPAPPSRVG